LKEEITRLKKEIKKSNPMNHYDAGSGLVYVNTNDSPNEQYKNELDHIQKETVTTDVRVCNVEILMDTLMERVTYLEMEMNRNKMR
jgi:hypothetical protein